MPTDKERREVAKRLRACARDVNGTLDFAMYPQITLPRDARGREISLDTKTLYDVNGKALDVLRWVFLPYDEGIRWRFECREFSRNCLPESFYLTPPDDWERLLEDLW